MAKPTAKFIRNQKTIKRALKALTFLRKKAATETIEFKAREGLDANGNNAGNETTD